MDSSLKKPGIPSKSHLRKHYISVRNNLERAFVKKASKSIAEKLYTLQHFINSDTIHCYVSIRKNNEVITDDIIKKCFELDKIVVIPKVEGDGKLSHHQIESLKKLEHNGWGVREPATENHWPVSKIGLVIVPMVAGDSHRNRLGYGKGYYDRFLSRMNCFKIGLLFHCQLHPEQLPAEPFDIRPDLIITENEVIY
jgi:5-formyltetrahydrofolate cyclo-ligase